MDVSVFFVVCRWKIYCLSDFDELFLIDSLVGKSLSEKCKRYATFTIFDIHVKGVMYRGAFQNITLIYNQF